ncbi:prepilin-type N-terminal cleavage/methylation domain-containing protein [Candidatus Daviesbacteria bacterium]|nr:prepilin-type N-terminal cleavage/methylation domain-containing protein [Candidatus Daviesbacteria bacterium]
MNFSRGFTLVELMVVIAIIAILAAIAITVFSGQQKNARDSQRRANIDAIANALESKKGSNATYQIISSSDFTSQTFPTDPGYAGEPSRYSICYNKTSGSSLAQNISPNTTTAASRLGGWPTGHAGPTGATANSTCKDGTITDGPLANANDWPQVDTVVTTAAFFTSGLGTFNWAICAKLEGAAGTQASPYYCRTNSQ